MSQEIINVGSAPNDGQGDPIRDAFIATNANFSQLFALPNPNPPVTLVGIPGDVPGMYAYDSSYFYYCYGSYNGTNTIWARVPQILTPAGNSSIGNGTSNVSVMADADVIVSVGGVANIATFTTTGVSVIGNVAVANVLADSYCYANGVPIPYTNYGNANVEAYLPSYTGNLDNTNNIYATGNVTGTYILGNGSQLTGVISSYGDSNVATFLPTYGGDLGNGSANVYADQINAVGIQTSGNVGVGNIEGVNVTSTITLTATGNVYGTYFIGDGGFLSNVSGGNGQAIINGNSYANIASAAGNLDIAVNGNAVGTFYDTGLSVSGNVTATNIVISGPTGNIIGANVISAVTFLASSNITSQGNLIIATSSSPASSDPGTPGQITWDSNWLYVCIAANTWARTALTSGY